MLNTVTRYLSKLFLQRTQVQFPKPTQQLTASITPGSDDPTHSSDLHKDQACIRCPYTHVSKILIHIK